MSIRKKVLVYQIIFGLFALVTITILSWIIIREITQRKVSEGLLDIAQVAASQIDGDLHAKIAGPDSAAKKPFLTLSKQLRKIRRSIALPAEQIYTLRPSGQGFEFVVMTQKPFIGDKAPFRPEMKSVFESGKATYTKELYETPNGEWLSAIAPIKNKAGKVVALLEIDENANSFMDIVAMNLRPMLVGTLISIVAIIILSVFLFNRFLRPLQQIGQRMQKLVEGSGDLTVKIDLQGEDEIAAVAKLIDSFVGSVADIIRDVKTFAGNVEETQLAIDRFMNALKAGVLEQSDALSNTSASNEELNASIHSIRNSINRQENLTNDTMPSVEQLLKFIATVEQNANQVNQRLGSSAERIAEGQEIMQSLIKEMNRINASSEEIEDIVKIIQNISDRIAMLALNASIEAARAGEQGRGFAVVAEEVSNLSVSTARQTKDISDIVNRNRSEILLAVERSLDSDQVYENIAVTTQEALRLSHVNLKSAQGQKESAAQGSKNLAEISMLTGQVAGAIREQTIGTDLITEQMTKISDVNQTTLASLDGILTGVTDMGQRLAKLKSELDRLFV